MSERRFFDDASDGHSDIQTNLHGTRKTKFSGTVEQNKHRQNKENVNRQNRIIAVREQEKQMAKRNTKEGREQERLEQEKQFEEEKLRLYIALKEEERRVEEAKRQIEIEAGQAHRNAEISIKLREDRERHRLEETQKNASAAANRANKAAATQRDLEEQMNGPRRKQLETRDKVMKEESDRAHQLAAEFREKEKDRSEEREDYTPYEGFNKNVSRGVYNKKVVGDFSKSHLHNSIVVSHAGEGQVSAFDAARREEERTTVRREEFRASKDDVRMKSLERWQSAAKKEKEKKLEKAFEDQMQRLQKAKNLQKIEEGKKYPEMQVKPATKLQMQNRNQKQAEKEFEDMFMGNRPNSGATTKGKKTTTKPPFKAPTLAPARPHPLVEQSTLSGGFDNTTNNEFQEQQHEESEEEEEQPRSTTVKEAEDPRGRRQPADSPPKYPDHEEEDEEEEEEEEEEPRSSKKYNPESSYSHMSRSGYDQQTPEESTMRQDEAAKRHGAMSFGDRQRQQANAIGKSPELSSYQQESTSQYERDNYLGQSQSSGLSDSRYQRREEEQQQEKTKQRRAVDNDINNYINEQEAFLQNLENHRKKLNDKLRTTTQENLPNEQPKRAAQPERQAANATKSSLNSTSKTVAVQEDEAIEDLQKRAESLLSRFMQPAKEEEEHSRQEEELEEEEDSLEYSPAKYGAGLGDTKTTQNNYNEQTQSYAYSQDELEEEKEYSPEKNHQQNRYRANARDDSPSELDYSMSDRGERSEKKSKGPAKVDYAVSFGTKQFAPQTETFGKKQNPFEGSNTRGGKQAEDKKAWKMDFDMADDQKVAPQTRSKPAAEQRERPSASSKNNKQGELIEDQDQAQGASLADLFQKNRKKMMEKYEQHQKEHHEKPEVKEPKPVRTKEEILKQRKAMMEYKAPLSVKAREQNQAERETRKEEDPFKKSRKSKSKEPKPELLDRLAFGKKATVDKKEMLKLTNKNYEMLPEVKKKKEEEKKKEEQRLRRENAKKLDKEIRSKLMK